jgi:hypothetical protein
MLEIYFTERRSLERLRAEPTGQYMDGFAEVLHTEGYGVWSGQAYLRAAGHLGIWIREQRIPVAELPRRLGPRLCP